MAHDWKLGGQKADPSFLDRIAGDVREIGAGIFHLPWTVVNEVRSLPQVPHDVSHALGEPGLGKILGDLSHTPGIRMLPGAFTLGNVGSPEGRHQLAMHPLMTFLDVLPYANRASLGITSALADAGEEASALSRAIPEGGLGLRDALKTTGRVTEDFLATKYPRFKDILPSQLMEHIGLGKNIRDFMERFGPSGLQNRKLWTELEQYIKQVHAEGDKAGISRPRMLEITKMMEQGAPDWRTKLTPRELGWVHFYEGDQGIRRWEKLGVERNLLIPFEGEVYSAFDSKEFTDLWGKWHDSPIDSAERSKLYLKLKERADKLTPARWKTVVSPIVNKSVEASLRDAMQPEDFARLMANVDGGHTVISEARQLIRGGKISNVDITGLIKEQWSTWQELKAKGYDPVFVHHVGEEQVSRMKYPRVVYEHTGKEPSQVLRRAWDMKPWVQDAEVALGHQAYEWLTHEHSLKAIEQMRTSNFIRTAADVRAALEPSVKAGLGTMDELVKREYRPFDPESIFPFRQKGYRAFAGPQDEEFIPKSIEKVIKTLGHPNKGGISKGLEFATGVFRMSVLGLNASYYLHIGLSSALLLSLETGPSVFRFMPEAIRMLKAGEIPAEISRGGFTLPERGGVQLADASVSFAAGRTIGRILKEVPKGIENFNQFLHDADQTMAYLHGKNRAERLGMGEAEANRIGIETAHKVMQRWDRMTPIERSAVRTVFPFYGFMKFIAGYALRFPFDHPLRISIISNFARNEFADWQTGLPQRFMQYFVFGKPNPKGDQWMLPLTSVVPFLNLANEFTFAGLASHMSPAGQGILRMFGVDPLSQGPELYPTLTFDPVSGKAVYKRPNMLMSFGSAFVPQLDAVEALLGWSSDLKGFRKHNPDAYTRYVLSQWGLRFIPTRVNIQSSIAKAARQQQAAEQSQRREQRYAG